MEKTFSLNPGEKQLHAAMEREQAQTFQQIGMLLLDLEAAKQRLALIQDRQRGLMSIALLQRGVGQCQGVRIAEGNLICMLSETPPESPPPVKPNGAVQPEV
jgi:hypothetical protein